MVWVEASCYGGHYPSSTSTSVCVCVTCFCEGRPISFQGILIQNLMLETPEEIELGVKHPVKKRKRKATDKLAACSDRIAVVRVWQTVVTPSLVTVKKSSMEEYCQSCQRSLLLCLWELRSRYLPCVYPSELTLNEINKFRLNWQLASKVIILPLMSPHWNGRRLGLRGNTAGCGRAVISNTKK